MSLVTHMTLDTRKHNAFTARKPRAKRAAGGLRNALATVGRYLVRALDAIGEARVHRAMIEAEVYRHRFLHSSKNDDDLPVIR